MNQIRIEEGIVTDISFSHKIKDVNYNQMLVLTKNSNGKESIIPIKYKEFDNSLYSVGSRVSCYGELRTYSTKLDGKNKVSIFVSTNFKDTDSLFDDDIELCCTSTVVDGVICSIQPLRVLGSGKCNIHFILKNTIEIDDHKYNSYIPCIAWGSLAKVISNLPVGQAILIKDGELRSREYVKRTETGDEIKLCHELYIKKIVPLIEENKEEQ